MKAVEITEKHDRCHLHALIAFNPIEFIFITDILSTYAFLCPIANFYGTMPTDKTISHSSSLLPHEIQFLIDATINFARHFNKAIWYSITSFFLIVKNFQNHAYLIIFNILKLCYHS